MQLEEAEPQKQLTSNPVQQENYRTIWQTLAILATSIGLGVLVDWLFGADLLGLNVSLLVSSLALTFFICSRRLKQDTLNLFLLGSCLLLAWLFFGGPPPFCKCLI